MRVLTCSTAINDEITRLLHKCQSCQIAVAWASPKLPSFRSLVLNKQKIERMVVGIHFCQTHPQFIKAFLEDTHQVRFALQATGVFHPKVYLFKHSTEEWECVVGSANFTRGGFTLNAEAAVLIGHNDVGAEIAYRSLDQLIESYWRDARTMSDRELEEYRMAWRKCRTTRKQLLHTSHSTTATLSAIPELTASAFTSEVSLAIKRIRGISKRWNFGGAGKTLSVSLNRSGKELIKLWIYPDDNTCCVEVLRNVALREQIAHSIRMHLQKLDRPGGYAYSDGGTVIRLDPNLQVRDLLQTSPRDIPRVARAFRDEVRRVADFFAFFDSAISNWQLEPTD